MSVTSIIDEMKDNLSLPIIKSQKEVCSLILKAHNIFLLDTCFVSRAAHICDVKNICEAFEKFSGGKTQKDIVFVITELVLYELKDSENVKLQLKIQTFIENLCHYGFCVLLLSEQCLYKEIGEYINRNSYEWNRFFTSLLRDNVAILKHTCSIVKSDHYFPYISMLELEFDPPKETNYIPNIINHIKNRKKEKDSLAEELICVCLLFFGDLVYKSDYNHFYFCSYDRPAIVMMNKAVQTFYGNNDNINFESIHLLEMIQYMIKEKILIDKTVAVEMLMELVGETVCIIENKKSPILSIKENVTVSKAVEMMFEGKEILFPLLS